MFLDTQPQGRPELDGEPRVTPMKLSEAIRKGHPIVLKEDKTDFRYCAMGFAWAGVHGRALTEDDAAHLFKTHGPMYFAQTMGRAMGFDPLVCQKVNDMHLSGKPALVIAAELEARGY